MWPYTTGFSFSLKIQLWIIDKPLYSVFCTCYILFSFLKGLDINVDMDLLIWVQNKSMLHSLKQCDWHTERREWYSFCNFGVLVRFCLLTVSFKIISVSTIMNWIFCVSAAYFQIFLKYTKKSKLIDLLLLIQTMQYQTWTRLLIPIIYIKSWSFHDLYQSVFSFPLLAMFMINGNKSQNTRNPIISLRNHELCVLAGWCG